MGWFLGGKSSTGRGGKRASKRGAGKSKGVGPSWDPQRTIMAAKLLVGFALLVTVVVGWRWGDDWLRAYAAQRHGVVMTADRVVLAEAPRWMTTAVREELQAFVAERVTGDPLEGESLRGAVVDLERQPWVERLYQVRRVAGGRVIVEAAYREPVAVVEARDGYHLVDRHGVRLPGLYERHQVSEVGLPLIIGVGSAPGPAGERWPGQDLQAGLALVQALSHEPFTSQIRAYDVSQRDPRGRPRLTLHTTGGGLVRWGLPPGEEQAIEPATATKLHWLRQVDEQRGAIDAGGKIVDVYGGTIQVSQPHLPGSEPMSRYAPRR